jgi:type IV pilus assembly protein PilA
MKYFSHTQKGHLHAGKKPQPPISGGFTLIELMIVIAIVAMLVALAVPAYKDYTIRSRVAECVNGGSIVKLAISEFRQSVTPAAWPPDEDTAATAAPNGDSQFCVAFVNYAPATGLFEIDVDEAEVGSALSPIQPRLTPTEEASGTISWRCTVGSTTAAAVKYLPSTCTGPNT